MRALVMLALLVLPMQVSAQLIAVNTDSKQYAQYASTADSIAEIVIQRSNEMSLIEWEILVTFDSLRITNEGQVAAWTEAQPTYYTARITFDLAVMSEMPYWLRNETVVHELAHIMSAELTELLMWVARGVPGMQPLLRRANEQLTTRIARMEIWRKSGKQ